MHRSTKIFCLQSLGAVFVALALIVGGGSAADAKIAGPCVDCHTMHNSQGGSAMNFNDSKQPERLQLRFLGDRGRFLRPLSRLG